MADLFQRLLMMRQLQFKEGEIDLLNQRVSFIPKDALLGITNFIIQRPELVPGFYESIRLTFGSGWAQNVKTSYGFTPKDYIRWLIDISNLSGWGKSELVKYDVDTDAGVFRTYNALVGTSLIGKSNVAVDHVWRALTAGGHSKVLEKDVDWIETKCVAKQDPFCEFIFKPRNIITESEKQTYKSQLP